MLNNEKDIFNSIEKKANPEDLGVVSYEKHMDLQYLFRFINPTTDHPIEYDEEFRKHAIIKIFRDYDK